MKNGITKILVFVLFIITFFVTGAYAWYALQTAIDLRDMEGNILTSYFQCGDGSEEKPYVITRPVHLYNLTMLYQELDGFDTSNYYFQIGYDLDGDGDLEVYSYNENNRNLNEYSDVLNMKYYAGKFVPIGTVDYPFNGTFNGNNFIIDNLTITGDGESDIGLFGYVGLQATIKDLYLDNLTINVSNADISKITVSDGHTEHDEDFCYVGYLAGHTETWTAFENVYMNNASIVGAAGVDIKNKYGYFGYCADGADLEKMVMKVQGDESGFGGSIGMNELYTRINSFEGQTINYIIQTGEFHYYNDGVEDSSKATTTSSTVAEEYYNDSLTGRVVYSEKDDRYLFGVREDTYTYTITNEYHLTEKTTAYYMNSNSYYLYFQTAGGNAGRTNQEANRTILLTDEDGWVYYVANDTKYYLYSTVTTGRTTTYDQNLRSSSTKQAYMFKIVSNKLTLYNVNNNSSQSRYIVYNNNNNPYFRVDTSSTNLTTLNNYNTKVIRTEKITSTKSYTTHGTYLPLNVYLSQDEITESVLEKLPDAVVNGAKLNNTGYIVGGTKDLGEYNSAVRVAQNYDYGDLYRAFGRTSDGGNRDRYSASALQILTRTYKSNGVTFISDSYNSGTALSNNLKNLTYVNDKNKHTVDELGLTGYNGARKNLDTQFSASQSKLYVLRFNEFQISLDNTIIAEQVLLNGEIKYNYELPESCIDFSLSEKGYISFFGGGFRGGNCNAFFSLYHVIRDENDNIIALKHLSKIYGTDKQKDAFIYEYEDGSFSIYNKKTRSYQETSLLDGYELYFDLNWVEAPGFTAVDNTCWYFEIPVNEGEYALGAVDGRTGAYMFYLDVGTAGGGIESVQNFENIDYLDKPNTAEISPLLFQYEETNGENVQIDVEFKDNSYYVTATADKDITIYLGILTINTTVIVNGTTYQTNDNKKAVYQEINITGSSG